MNCILDPKKSNQRYFEEISKIPRKSFYEKEISDYIVNFAEERGLWVHQDAIGNVVVRKSASPGFETAEPIMLQAHLDMVCEKAPDIDFDFLSDPIRIYVEDGWVKAKGTTLGADDGAGVSLILAILDDDELGHPEIECVFTVQEEDGMGGALNLDYSMLRSRRMIALDGLKEGTSILSTTGLSSGYIKKDITLSKSDKPSYLLAVKGLIGGHAALNIGKEQGNSIKLAARILHQINKSISVHLVSLSGGTILNGIPQSCKIIFTCTDNIESLQSIVCAAENQIKEEYKNSDPDLAVDLQVVATEPLSMDEETSKDIIDLLYTMPTGVQMRSRVVADHPVASRNIGTIENDQEILSIGCACRALLMTQVDDMVEQMTTLCGKFGARYEEKFKYSGYQISEDSPLLKIWSEVYLEEAGKKLDLTHIHSGTDAGTIAEKMGGMDIIVLMPNTENVHSYHERMELASFDRTYGYLRKIIQHLDQKISSDQ